MAFDQKWVGADGSQAFDTAGNWSPSGSPAGSETSDISSGISTIDSGLGQSGLAAVTLRTGIDFTGSLGSPSNRLELGATTLIRVNSPGSKQLCFHPTNLTDAVILGCGTGTYGCYWYDGTITNMLIDCGSGVVRIGALCNITNLYILSGVVYIESGAAIGFIKNYGGTIHNSADITVGTGTVTQWGGRFHHEGRVTADIDLFELFGGILYFSCEGGTVTDLNVYGGLCDGKQHVYENTVTDCQIWRGGEMRMNEHTIHANAPIGYGGVYTGPGSVDQKLPLTFPR